MVKFLEYIDLENLKYLLNKFSPIFEWDVISYFIGIAANLRDEKRKFELYNILISCDFVVYLLLSISI